MTKNKQAQTTPEKQPKDGEDIEALVVEAVTEKPVTFTLDGRYFYVYPPSLGISFLSSELLKQLHIDNQLLVLNQQVEMLRMCTEQKESVLRIVAIHTFQRRSDAIREEKVQERLKDLAQLGAAELSTLLLAIMRWNTFQDKFVRHFNLDKERKQRDEISRVKSEDGSTVTFGGRSIYGSLLDHACERYKWELGYVLWGISLTNLNMMLADSVQSVYLTEKERRKAHISTDGIYLNGDDPRNARQIQKLLRGH